MVVKEYTESGALVVGGSSGIGLQTACHLAAAGVPRIALAGRDRRRLDAAAATVRDHGDVDVAGVAFDAADPAAAAAGIEEAESHLRGIDVLICSVASSAEPDLLHDIAPEEVLGVVSGQLLPPLVTTRLVVPGMYRRGGGSIVLIASDAAKVATPGESILGGAMAGIVMFARTVALEAKRHGVRINAVTPSLVRGTPTTERLTASGFSARLFAAAEKQAHLGVAEPADVAELVTFLAGPGARRITGQAVSVNGGISVA